VANKIDQKGHRAKQLAHEKMDEIEFTADGITLRELIKVFGDSRKEERLIKYDDRERYEIQVDTGGYVSLEKLIDVEYTDDDSIKSVSLQFEDLPSVEAEIQTEEQHQKPSGVPDVPYIDLNSIDVDARRNFYRRLREHPDSQPATIREIIYSKQKLSRQEFDRLVEAAEYEPSGGGIRASLVVLEDITGEIERRGRGEDTQIIWTGAE
jgi:hypothetical protein